MKYYIESGNYRMILDGNDPKSAVLESLDMYFSEELGEDHDFGRIIVVSEVGFHSEFMDDKNWKKRHENDVIFLTDDVFEELGIEWEDSDL